jgi:peptidoglycan/LPS O-acetylase OafA/YrhL
MAQGNIQVRNFQLIDLVRSFCILSVLAIHSDVIFEKSQNSWVRWSWEHFQRNGVYGVYLFFVVSGFLITKVLAKNPGGLSNPSFKIFYIQRVGRILPLLLTTIWIGICILLTSPSSHFDYLDVFRPEVGNLSPAFWFSIATFTFNWFLAFHTSTAFGLYWGILWSLCVEEQFYLFFPIFLKKIKSKNLWKLLLTIVLFAILWRWLSYFLAPSNRYLQTAVSFGAFDSIAIGSLLYLADQRWGAILTQNRKKSVVLCGIGFIITVAVYWNTTLSSLDQIYVPTLLDVGLALFLIGGLKLNFFESRFLSLFSLPGKYCYGGYLLHPIILAVTFPILFRAKVWWGFGLFALITTVVAGISYHFFEMPANRLVRKTFNKI